MNFKPGYVCEPGDERVKKYGWTAFNFSGYLSLVEDTIWISAVNSLHPGRGNLSKMIRKFHQDGYIVKVPAPFPRMEKICEHLGFNKTTEMFPEAGEEITVYVLPSKYKTDEN